MPPVLRVISGGQNDDGPDPAVVVGDLALRDLADRARLIERELELSLVGFDEAGDYPAPERLRSAMRYSLMAGGKRLRPTLVLEVALAVSGRSLHDVLPLCRPAMLAIEYVHTYSLIHDDLPSMDNDVMRRGKPTLHIATDEATAILAGDALLTDAFALLATARHRAADQVLELALGAGSIGMVAGQVDDIDNVGHPDFDVDIDRIHHRKTGALFAAACVMGALCVDGTGPQVEAMRRYGQALGLAFQIADDLIDATSTADVAGKNVGRDDARHKITYVSRYGVTDARARAVVAAKRAAFEARRLRHSAVLEALAALAVDRDH